MIDALKEIYEKETELKELLNTIDSYRITRHAIQYSGAACNKEDSTEAIKDAEKFIELAEKILFSKNK